MIRKITISLQVNGQPIKAQVEPRLTLADFLRKHLKLTGTHQKSGRVGVARGRLSVAAT